MKKLKTLLFLLLVTTLSNAQTTKPTIEETVQYIKNELQGKKHQNINEILGPFIGDIYKTHHDSHYFYTDMKIESCILSWKESWTNVRRQNGVITKDNSKTTHKFIDFSKVEFLKPDEYNDGYLFGFRSINTDGSTRYEDIFINNAYVSPIIDYSANSSKIYKAFQHLRKLCGAPEPISFD